MPRESKMTLASLSFIAIAALAVGSGCRRGGGSDDPEGCACVEDGFCCATCRDGIDPDCGNRAGDGDGDVDGAPPDCGSDDYCNRDCEEDPDCCTSDGVCDGACSDDPDCVSVDCGADGVCNPACTAGADPDCVEEPDCISDGYCNPACPDGTDPDCVEEPDCSSDGLCNPECPEGDDPDCDEDCPPTVPLLGECDPLEQRCCAAGERCTLSDGSPPQEVCISSIGPGSDGDVCFGGEGECRAGAICVFMGVQACATLCRTGADCPLGFLCEGMSGAASMYSVCAPSSRDCDPLSGSGCAAGQSCVVVSRSSYTRPFLTCYPTGEHGPGTSCADGRGCIAGSGCHDTGAGWQCYRQCELWELGCPTGEYCADVGHMDYGLCVAG